jgi:hypothetical protein
MKNSFKNLWVVGIVVLTSYVGAMEKESELEIQDYFHEKEVVFMDRKELFIKLELLKSNVEYTKSQFEEKDFEITYLELEIKDLVKPKHDAMKNIRLNTIKLINFQDQKKLKTGVLERMGKDNLLCNEEA